MPTTLLVAVLSGAGEWPGRRMKGWYQHLIDPGGTSKNSFNLLYLHGHVGSKGKLVPDKTLEIGWYQHLFGADGTQKYFWHGEFQR